MNTKSIFTIIAIVIAMTTLGLNNSSVFATTKEQKASDQAWADGCSDAATGTSNAFNNHPNASHHSATYIGTYQLALKECVPSITTTNVATESNSQNQIDNSDQNNRNQAQTAAINHSPQNCFVLLGSCSTANNLGQDLTN